MQGENLCVKKVEVMIIIALRFNKYNNYNTDFSLILHLLRLEFWVIKTQN